MTVVAWPPPTPPNGRGNPTAQVDSHPSDHNRTADALDTIIARLSGLVVVRAVGTAQTGQSGNTVTAATLAVPAAPAGVTARWGLLLYTVKLAVPTADPVCTMTLSDPASAGVLNAIHYPLVNNTHRFMVGGVALGAAAGNYTVKLSHSGTGSYTTTAVGNDHSATLLIVPA